MWAFFISAWCMGRHEWQRGNWITSSSLLTHSIWPSMSIIYFNYNLIYSTFSRLFDMKTKIFLLISFYDHKYRISVRYFLILIFSFFSRVSSIENECVYFFQCHLRDILYQPTQRRREIMRIKASHFKKFHSNFTWSRKISSENANSFSYLIFNTSFNSGFLN